MLKIKKEFDLGWTKRVEFLKEINGEPAGTIKDILVAKMIGRNYSPDKDSEGKFIDKVGVPDNRFMVMGNFGINDEGKLYMDCFYKVFNTEDELHESFRLLNHMPQATLFPPQL